MMTNNRRIGVKAALVAALGGLAACGDLLEVENPGSYDDDDLNAPSAMAGLVVGMSFDLSRGLAFSTYAVRRIRGAILDDLRSRDWTPRSVRAKNRKLLAATAELQGRLGRMPAPRELASTLGIDLETFWKWRGAMDHASRSRDSTMRS